MKSVLKIEDKEIAKRSTIITQVRKGWDEAFKQAILKGDIPENDMFEGMKNAFDDSEW